MRTLEDMVRQEVIYCVSGLVHTLATGGYGESRDVQDLAEQALELSMPLLDYESAAEEDGAKLHYSDDGGFYYWPEPNPNVTTWDTPQQAAEGYCDGQSVEPHEREVFEHWIITDWLADQLEAQGEKVDKDFAGMTVWARTTTGQAISMDYVIEKVYEEARKRYEEVIA